MSHIPASKMPHAKPHEHDEHAPSVDAASPAEPSASEAASPAPATLTGSPEITKGPTTPEPTKIEPAKLEPTKSKQTEAGTSTTFYVAIAAVGAIAIGGIVAALALRQPEALHKGGKGKAKGRGRKGRHSD